MMPYIFIYNYFDALIVTLKDDILEQKFYAGITFTE
jgi:hypothetical protein